MTHSINRGISDPCVPVSITDTVTSTLETLPSRFDRVSKGKQPVEAKEIKDAGIAEGKASCNWVTVEGEAKFSP